MNQMIQDPGVMLADDADADVPAGYTLVDALTWLGERKFAVLGFTFAAVLAAVATAYLLPNEYTARTTLLPPNSQQSGGAAAALAALGTLGNAVGLSPAKTPDELYVALLRSDSVVRPLIEQFDLKTRFETPTFDEARRKFMRVVRISSDKKSSVIAVEVDDQDPAFAARLANAHVGELGKVLSRLAVSEAQQRRIFFGKQLEETNAELLKAEQQLTRLQQSSGLIVVDKQAEALIAGVANLRAQIAEREVRLRVLRMAATDENPEAIRMMSELEGLRAELRRLEANPGAKGPKSPLDLAVRGLPDAAADYARAMRQVKYQEAMFQSMLRQFEAARLDEAKEANTVQQIDVAVPPDRKSKPARGLIVIGAALAALLLACLWAVWRGWRQAVSEADPQHEGAWRGLKRAWSLGGR